MLSIFLIICGSECQFQCILFLLMHTSHETQCANTSENKYPASSKVSVCVKLITLWLTETCFRQTDVMADLEKVLIMLLTQSFGGYKRQCRCFNVLLRYKIFHKALSNFATQPIITCCLLTLEQSPAKSQRNQCSLLKLILRSSDWLKGVHCLNSYI